MMLGDALRILRVWKKRGLRAENALHTPSKSKKYVKTKLIVLQLQNYEKHIIKRDSYIVIM